MFTWLKKLLANKSAAVDQGTDLYKPSKRKIYRYFDGEKIVSADPMTLYRHFMGNVTDFSMDLQGAISPLKTADKCYESARNHLRRLFGTKSLEDGGLTDPELWDLMESFLAYIDDLKKNSSTSAISPAALWQGLPSPTAAGQPTESILESGSTANGQSTDKLESLPSEPPSPTI